MSVKPLDYLRAISDDRELSALERLVALMIMRHAGSTGTRSHPGNKLLAAETGLDIKTVKRATKSLREKGWIILTHSGRGRKSDDANEYDLAIPKGHDDPLPGDQRDTGSEQRDIGAVQRDTSGATDALDSNALEMLLLRRSSLYSLRRKLWSPKLGMEDGNEGL